MQRVTLHAVVHGRQALALDGDNVKALYRRASALAELEEFDAALEARPFACRVPKCYVGARFGRWQDANRLLAMESAKNDGKRLLQIIKDRATAAKRREQQTFAAMFQ